MANTTKKPTKKKGRPKKATVNTKVRIDMDNSVKTKKKEYRCTCCGKTWGTQSSRFNKTRSPLYKENNGYLTICKDCLEEYYNKYVEVFSGSEEHAIERICQLIDVYYDESVLEGARMRPETSKLGAYMSKVALSQTRAKGITYLDTVNNRWLAEQESRIRSDEDLDNMISEKKASNPTRKVVEFWGKGYTNEEYRYLQREFERWTTTHECKTVAKERIFQKICVIELAIRREQEKPIPDEKAINSNIELQQKLFANAGIKPSQTDEDNIGQGKTFGILIKEWEVEKPIVEKPEYTDLDRMITCIRVFFAGHLAHMLGIQTKDAKLYEEYLKMKEEYGVKRPELEDDEIQAEIAEVLFGKIKGGA